MARRFLVRVVIAAALLATAAGCATTTGRLYVRLGPSPVVVERRLVAPGPEYAWLPGVYHWSGREYVWAPGHYERAPRPRATWVPDRWAHDRHGWYLIDGHWR